MPKPLLVLNNQPKNKETETKDPVIYKENYPINNERKKYLILKNYWKFELVGKELEEVEKVISELEFTAINYTKFIKIGGCIINPSFIAGIFTSDIVYKKIIKIKGIS